MEESRWEPRQNKGGSYSLVSQGRNSNAYATEGNGIDISDSGVGIECAMELKVGSIFYVRAKDGSIDGTYEVVHCTRRGAKFRIGMEARDEEEDAPRTVRQTIPAGEPDHYETLQINPKADAQTIHRVFRMMAARFHPDNPETGDVERFLEMKQAYAVLSDPERRAEYDAHLERNRADGPLPIFELKDFVTGVEAEGNRRLGVCCLLYRRRQTNPDAPGISLLDLEREMGFPREYLSFTMWYLRAKDFITVADNSDYALTAAGAEFVESKAVRHEIVARLLTPAMRSRRSAAHAKSRRTGTGPQTPNLLTS